ncbi:MAG TPA: hypothetical protein VIV12_02375 [Streptosporangiaceae bacterium]
MSVGDRGEYLRQVLPLLWPPPARITRCGRMTRSRAAAAEFLIFPSERRAALLVPRRPRRAAAAALRHYKASASARDRLRFRLAAIAAGTGAAEVLPDRVRIEPAGPAVAEADIASHLSAALRRQAIVSLHVGAPRANRKPVLQVLAPDGAALGFAKVGVNPLTRELVRAEATALALLAQAPLTHVRPPRLLYHGQWRGNEVLIQEAFPAARPARNHGELGGAMTEIAGIRGLSHLPAAQSSYWQRLRTRLRALDQREAAGSLLAALGALERAEGELTLAVGSWHGDWTPWNMTMSRGQALVWDWERFETGVPVGFDAVHYWLQGAIIRSGTPPVTAAEMAVSRAAELVAPLGVAPQTASLVAALYLVEIAARYLHDGQAEAGARLGRVEEWLLPVLTGHTRRLSSPLRASGGG